MDEDLRQLLRDLNGLLQTLLAAVGVMIKNHKGPEEKAPKAETLKGRGEVSPLPDDYNTSVVEECF